MATDKPDAGELKLKQLIKDAIGELEAERATTRTGAPADPPADPPAPVTPPAPATEETPSGPFDSFFTDKTNPVLKHLNNWFGIK